jgi:hypothetical protein
LTNSFPDILKVRNTEVSPPKLPLINHFGTHKHTLVDWYRGIYYLSRGLE